MEDAKNIAKNYNPAEFEDKLYNEWVEKGYFHAEVDKTRNLLQSLSRLQM